MSNVIKFPCRNETAPPVRMTEQEALAGFYTATIALMGVIGIDNTMSVLKGAIDGLRARKLARERT